MTSHIGKLVFLGLILTSMIKSRSAEAVDLINTPSLLGSYGSASSSDPTTQYAQSFTTTASGYVVNQVDLRLFRNSGEGGTYSVSIYSSTGSGNSLVPDTLVASVATGLDMVNSAHPVPVSGAGDGSDVSSVSFTGLNFSLNSSPTDYFILVSYSGSYSVSWAAVTASSPTFNGNNTYTAQVSSGTPSNFGDSDPLLLKVTAGTTVPEPSTWAMAGLALAGLAASARRSRRQA